MRSTTTVVIAAAAVLAAVIVTRTPGQQEGIDAACCLPSGDCLFINETQCANNFGVYHPGMTCPQVNCTPTVQPTVVGVSILRRGVNDNLVYRAWSDGQVDLILTDDGIPCPTAQPPCVIIPGTCPTDVDRDGDTGINDFLTLLGGWGACR